MTFDGAGGGSVAGGISVGPLIGGHVSRAGGYGSCFESGNGKGCLRGDGVLLSARAAA